MLYDNGINITVKNARIAISASFQLISANETHISEPTIIRAGAVTSEVTTERSGEKNVDNKNIPPTTTLENPVLAPTEAPDNDSIYDVVLVVPNIEPTHVAIESATKALEPFSIDPSSLTSPTFDPTATKVPAVSKKSINNIVKTTISICGVKTSFIFESAYPKVGAIDGTDEITLLGVSISPDIISTITVHIIPTKIATLTFHAINAPVNKSPNIASNTLGLVKLPIETKVASFCTTIPAPLKPINAINNPIPAVTADFKF